MTMSYQEFLAGKPAGTELARLQDDIRLPAIPKPIRRPGLYRNVLKRVFDVAAIVMAAPFVVPIVAVLSVAVRRDGGSAFYTQQRVGKDGRHFRMWKLRTMVSDADTRIADYLASNPEARREWEQTQKLKADPRITPLGHFLRRSSLDELPQLWNVLTGEMSLVGPRPIMLNQQSMYHGSAYYAVRPGITGLWQTAGRNRTTFGARAEFDTEYEANLSFRSDVSILSRTVSVVVRCTGY